MGWTTTYKPKGQSVKDFLLEGPLKFTNSETTQVEVLDVKVVNMLEAYAAVKFMHEGKDDEVIAFCFMLRYYPKDDCYNFGYKDMDETMGPYMYNCPKSILELLTPTDNENAKVWRAGCQKNAEKRMPKLGETIILERAIRFTDGVMRSRFEVVRAHDGSRKKIYRCLETGMFVNITGLKKMNYTIEADVKAA